MKTNNKFMICVKSSRKITTAKKQHNHAKAIKIRDPKNFLKKFVNKVYEIRSKKSDCEKCVQIKIKKNAFCIKSVYSLLKSEMEHISSPYVSPLIYLRPNVGFQQTDMVPVLQEKQGRRVKLPQAAKWLV